ncbi:Flp family type IVb pilin [Candidatus Nitrospira salsa]
MEKQTLVTLLAFFQDEDGATALEYGLLAALIAAVIIGAVTTLGQVVGNTFNNIASSMKAAS